MKLLSEFNEFNRQERLFHNMTDVVTKIDKLPVFPSHLDAHSHFSVFPVIISNGLEKTFPIFTMVLFLMKMILDKLYRKNAKTKRIVENHTDRENSYLLEVSKVPQLELIHQVFLENM